MNLKYIKKWCLGVVGYSLLSSSGAALATSFSLLKISKLILSSALLLNGVARPVEGTDTMCCLCDECGPPVEGRYELLLDESGTTCMDMLFEMADTTNDSTPGSSKCQTLYNKYHQTCCDPNFDPDIITQAPTPAPEYIGPWEPCDVCLDGSFPRNPAMVIASLYWNGPVSCRDLYKYGRQGNFIRNWECDAVQWFVQEPCGCNEPTPRPTPQPSSRPTPQPTIRGEAPTSRPVRKTPPANGGMTKIGRSNGRGGVGGMR